MNKEIINKMIWKIESYLTSNHIDVVNLEQLNRINARSNGYEYTFRDHLRGFIYALLSNQRKWITIIPHLPSIDQLFFDYDDEALLTHSPEYFINGIFQLKCGNISTQKQMHALADNILLFRSLIRQYGSIEAFYRNHSVDALARLLSDPKSSYKLKGIGHALAWQYLRNVGFDGAKPDVHLRRILGAKRLGYGALAMATENEVLTIIKLMSSETGYSCSYINDLLWYYCAAGYGDICSAKPHCDQCCIRMFCHYV